MNNNEIFYNQVTINSNFYHQKYPEFLLAIGICQRYKKWIRI